MRSGNAFAIVGAALLLVPGVAVVAQSAPPLRSAASFVVLGNSSVTNTGASRVTGNVGTSPGDAVTGLSSGMFRLGDVRRDDALAREARRDSDAAGDEVSREPCDVVLADAALGGKTVRGGVYCFASPDVQLDGTLLLDAAGDRDAVWIFRIAGTLTTGSDAQVLVVGSGYDGNVFWSTGGAATLGARTSFIGNLFAGTNVTLREGASISGRAFARTGSVTLQANELSLCCVPLLLTPATLPPGIPGELYHQTIGASGGMAPYTFTISSGTLPAGMVLTPNGTLQGIPAAFGTYRFTITATDANGCSGTNAYTIRVAGSVPTLSSWMLFAVSILLAGAGWIAIGRR
jgi:Ice-binding-like/Putative Ig domain